MVARSEDPCAQLSQSIIATYVYLCDTMYTITV